jgi:hypothetical protein
MKIIKSFAAILVCISSSTLLHAQEVKTEIAKPIEAKTAATDASKPSPQPVFKPQPQVAATATDVPAAAETPSPLTRKEDAKQPEGKDKLEAKTLDKNDIATPGGEEGKKIMAGKTTRPKDPIYSPSTADAAPAPPVTKSSAVNQQQQQ